MTVKPALTAHLLPNGPEFRLSGQDARTLGLLVDKGEAGVTCFDFPGGVGFRLAAYVLRLRRRGFGIVTLREPHDGGSHARYKLISDVAIVSRGRAGS